jgi:hypothetical protein
MLDKENHIKRYKELYKKKEGIDLTDQEALEHFEKLIRIVNVVYQPFKKEYLDGAFCPSCRNPMDSKGFRDTNSEMEFLLSGLCQECQDKTFK